MSSATARIRNAEKDVAQARDALKKAKAGLRKVESMPVDEGRSRPVLKASMLVALLSVIGFFVFSTMSDN